MEIGNSFICFSMIRFLHLTCVYCLKILRKIMENGKYIHLFAFKWLDFCIWHVFIAWEFFPLPMSWTSSSIHSHCLGSFAGTDYRDFAKCNWIWEQHLVHQLRLSFDPCMKTNPLTLQSAKIRPHLLFCAFFPMAKWILKINFMNNLNWNVKCKINLHIFTLHTYE